MYTLVIVHVLGGVAAVFALLLLGLPAVHVAQGRLRALVLIPLALAMGADPGRAQEGNRLIVQASMTQLSSAEPTLGGATGAGLGVMIRLERAEWVGVSFAWAQVQHRSERDGLACRRVHPTPFLCQPDRLAEAVTVNSIRVAAHPTAQVTYGIRLVGGVGISMNELRATSQGIETSLPGNLYTTESGHLGGFIDLGLAWSPFPYVPVGLNVGAGSHWIQFAGCHTDRGFHTPHCGVKTLPTLRAGVSVGFGF